MKRAAIYSSNRERRREAAAPPPAAAPERGADRAAAQAPTPPVGRVRAAFQRHRGLALFLAGTLFALLLVAARDAGALVMQALGAGTRPRDVLTRPAFLNAVAAATAEGASSPPTCRPSCSSPTSTTP